MLNDNEVHFFDDLYNKENMKLFHLKVIDAWQNALLIHLIGIDERVLQ
jgi:hypothetical protein